METETTEKIRCLVAKLRGPLAKFDNFAAGYSEAADAIDLLLAEVEAAAADKPDAERYRALRRGQHWSVVNGIGDMLRGDELDAAIDAVRARGM